MFWFRLSMIHSEPPISSATISTPNASASTLFVLSRRRCQVQEETRCTPICATASTPSITGIAGPRSVGIDDGEGCHGQQGGQHHADQVNADTVRDALGRCTGKSGRDVVRDPCVWPLIALLRSDRQW